MSIPPDALADAIAAAAPSIVCVEGRARRPSSGILIGPGRVLAADHAIERDSDLRVVDADGRVLAAEVAGRDPSSDLAALRVPGLDGPAATAAPGARVGQLLAAVGRPGADGVQASLGIVSAVGGPLRTRRGGVVAGVLRTDAVPFPGFSGGPIVDLSGRVLGVLTTGLVGGVALAIPAALAWRVADALFTAGRVARAWLGVATQAVAVPAAARAAGAADFGLLVVGVSAGSPAEAGGLLVGDVVVAIDAQHTSDAHELQDRLALAEPGQSVSLSLVRGGQATALTVTLGEQA
ncbi:MAG: S1C family serine protease [Ardenticatenales bacterium]